MAHEFLDEATEIAESIVADRRAIHRHPELKFEEKQTASLVARRLRELGIEVREGVGKTGVTGLLRGSRPGKTVLLRADMDALPIDEPTTAPYASECPGVMHACGHDGHTAMLLGAARLLVERRDFPGNVRFMFQPGEEGGAGALRMIQDGVLEDPPVDAAFALHVDALYPTGRVATRMGPSMASADEFTIVVRGAGGHAARPQLAVDPVVVASHIVVALQTLVSREVDPVEPAVVTVGSITGGTAFNVIPDTETLRGTVLTYSPEVQDQLEGRLTELATDIAKALRASATVDYVRDYPPLVNYAAGSGLVESVVRDLLGPDACTGRDRVMGSEDFSYVLERVPDGAMFWLGVRHPDWAEPRPIHSPTFDLDERALPIGAAVMAEMAVRYLTQA
jgi:amidohydrolase